MKKLVLSVLALLVSVAIYAQDEAASSDKKLSFGAKAGVNFASISDVDESSGESIKGRTSFHVGGVVQYTFSEKFALQGELLYSEAGNKYEYTESFNYDGPVRAGGGNYSYNEESTTKLSYISMPLMAQYFIISGLSVEAGPQFSLLVSAKEEWEWTETFDGGSNSESGSIDLKDVTNTVDVAGHVGATYELPLGLFFTARYVFGLTKINDDITINGITIDTGVTNRNNIFQLSAGYKFN